MFKSHFWKETDGYSLSELMIVLIILGILALLAIPRFMGAVDKAYAVEAKQQLKLVKTYQEAYYYEHSRFATALNEIGFEQAKLSTDGGTAHYQIKIEKADENDFVATAQSMMDFDKDGVFNMWEVRKDGKIKERTPD